MMSICKGGIADVTCNTNRNSGVAEANLGPSELFVGMPISSDGPGVKVLESACMPGDPQVFYRLQRCLAMHDGSGCHLHAMHKMA